MALPIFSKTFTDNCLELFKQQYRENELYREFCQGLKRTPTYVERLDQIPFLPIDFFKYHKVYAAPTDAVLAFKSSGTTAGFSQRSIHHVDSDDRYIQSIVRGFKEFFDQQTTKPIKLFALLPGYLDNKESSLIYMIEALGKAKLVEFSGYYLNDFGHLKRDLEAELSNGKSTILLWGVSFALLDFCEQHTVNLSEHIVLETGGMKGRRKEIVRKELHELLCKGFGVLRVFSEYGMTELLSQAYSDGYGIFKTSPHMGVLCRDVYDPLSYVLPGQNGVLNIIDLNNRYSCGFIATQDLGKVYSDGTFEVTGRIDHADIRGCNLLAI